MKKVLTVLVLALALVSAWSCKKSSGNDSQSEPECIALISMKSFTTISAEFEVRLTSNRPIVRRGLIWTSGSITPRFDDTNYHSSPYEGSENQFTMSLTGLMPDSPYNVCAYMDVNMGDDVETIYSNTISFTTAPEDI